MEAVEKLSAVEAVAKLSEEALLDYKLLTECPCFASDANINRLSLIKIIIQVLNSTIGRYKLFQNNDFLNFISLVQLVGSAIRILSRVVDSDLILE